MVPGEVYEETEEKEEEKERGKKRERESRTYLKFSHSQYKLIKKLLHLYCLCKNNRDYFANVGNIESDLRSRFPGKEEEEKKKDDFSFRFFNNLTVSTFLSNLPTKPPENAKERESAGGIYRQYRNCD